MGHTASKVINSGQLHELSLTMVYAPTQRHAVVDVEFIRNLDPGTQMPLFAHLSVYQRASDLGDFVEKVNLFSTGGLEEIAKAMHDGLICPYQVDESGRVIVMFVSFDHPLSLLVPALAYAPDGSWQDIANVQRF